MEDEAIKLMTEYGLLKAKDFLSTTRTAADSQKKILDRVGESLGKALESANTERVFDAVENVGRRRIQVAYNAAEVAATEAAKNIDLRVEHNAEATQLGMQKVIKAVVSAHQQPAIASKTGGLAI